MRRIESGTVDRVVKPMFNARQRTLDHYVIKIELLEVPHRVFRVLSVPSDIYLNYLEELIVLAMGWSGYHLSQIEAGDLIYCAREDLELNRGGQLFARMRDHSLFTLRDVMKKKDDSFTLVYDFGDDWKHQVTLIEKDKYPEGYEDDAWVEVVGGEGCCPPDDCGGSSGYVEMLNALRLGSDEEREEMENWLSIWGIKDYDVREFNLRETKCRVADYQRTLESVRRGMYREGEW